MGLRRSFKPNNLAINGSFENSSIGWTAHDGGTKEVVTSESKHGSKSAHIAVVASTGSLIQHDIAIPIGNKVYISAWGKRASGSSPATLTITNYGGYTNPESLSWTKSDWTLKSKIRTVLDGGITVGVGAYSSQTLDAYYDAIFICDLTTTFGAGLEPGIATCDKIFTAWFDGKMSGGIIGGTGGLK